MPIQAVPRRGCNCTSCGHSFASQNAIPFEEAFYSPETHRWEVRRRGGEGEMPGVPEEDVPTREVEEPALPVDVMDFPFITPRLDEEVVVIRKVSQESELWRIREHLLNRPFYGVNVQVRQDGRVDVSCRCMIRREQVVAGEGGRFANLRSFYLVDAVVERFPISSRRPVYQEYLRRVTPGYRELPPDFDFSIKGDDESKIVKREIKATMPKFAGWWSLRKAAEKYRECLFLYEKTEIDPRSNQATTTLLMVDYKGDPIEEMVLMKFYGDVSGEPGYVTMLDSISEDCPFRTNPRASNQVALERE
jgi:hypothetical protein